MLSGIVPWPRYRAKYLDSTIWQITGVTLRRMLADHGAAWKREKIRTDLDYVSLRRLCQLPRRLHMTASCALEEKTQICVYYSSKQWLIITASGMLSHFHKKHVLAMRGGPCGVLIYLCLCRPLSYISSVRLGRSDIPTCVCALCA